MKGEIKPVGYLKAFGWALVAAIVGAPAIIVFNKYSEPGDLKWENFSNLWGSWGSFLFVIAFTAALIEEKRKVKRDAIIERYPQSTISPFSVDESDRTIALELNGGDEGCVTIEATVSFSNRRESDTRQEFRFDVGFSRRGGSKVNVCRDVPNSYAAREIARVLMQAEPPVIPVKWKSGVLTVTETGMKYAEGPYDLGPLADDLIGNLVIVQGLKTAAGKVEAIIDSARRDA